MKREKALERKISTEKEESLGQYFGKKNKRKQAFTKVKKAKKVVSWGLPSMGKTKPLRL